MRHLLPILLCLAACGSGGDSSGSAVLLVLLEQEPNETTAAAAEIFDGRAGYGVILSAADVDFWSFDAAAGEYYAIELLAGRMDQEGWDDLCNTAQLTLLAPDGVTKLLEHDAMGAWPLGRHDLDFPLVRIPATGTYFLRVATNAPGVAGAAYAVALYRRTVSGQQFEDEPPAQTGGNDGPLTAEVIAPGSIHGHHRDGNSDWYRFTVDRASAIFIEMVSSRNGLFGGDTEYYVPRLNLFDADGATLRTTVDGAYFDDPLLCARLPAAGVYFLEVTQADGGGDADYILGFSSRDVDQLFVETEANDTVATADGVTYGTVFQGTITTADTDFFAFSGVAGDEVLVEVIPAIATTPMALEFFAPGGMTVQPSDTNTFGGYLTGRTILPASGVHTFRVTGLTAQPMVYVVSLARRLHAPFETEANDDIAGADGLDGAGRAAGVISAGTDEDVFRFDARENELVVVSVLARRVVRGEFGSDGFTAFSGNGSELEPRLRVLQGDGTPLAVSLTTPDNDCTGTEGVWDGQPTMAVAFVAPATATYYVEVSSEDGAGGADHFYVVQRR